MAKNDTNHERGQIRGYLFEMVVLHLLLKNGFTRVSTINTKETHNRVREKRAFFVELRGRGSWHQIDCPCDYSILSPFMYPIRLIGEVKYHKDLIYKDTVREFIGVLRDIQENYVIPVELEEKNSRAAKLPCRYIEVGAIFAAKGFNRSAELLAYAQGIKTISYKDNYLVRSIKEAIDRLEENLPYSVFQNDEISFLEYVDHCFKEKIHSNEMMLDNRDSNYSEYAPFVMELVEATKRIKSDFYATTYEGILIHFLSEYDFPESLFLNDDCKTCNVHYRKNRDHDIEFWLTIDGADDTKYYFTPPELLLDSVNNSYKRGLHQKEKIFQELSFTRYIDNKIRMLKLRIDKAWLDRLKKGIKETNS